MSEVVDGGFLRFIDGKDVTDELCWLHNQNMPQLPIVASYNM